MYVCMCVCTYVCMYVCVCVYVCMYVCMFVCMYMISKKKPEQYKVSLKFSFTGLRAFIKKSKTFHATLSAKSVVHAGTAESPPPNIFKIIKI